MLCTNPEQELYDAIYTNCLVETNSVYDYLPQENEAVTYPFVYVGSIDVIASATNSGQGGTYTVSVDVWGTKEQRLEVSSLTDTLYKQACGWLETDNYKFYAFPNKQSKRLTQDTSVPNTVFNRGSLMLVYELN